MESMESADLSRKKGARPLARPKKPGPVRAAPPYQSVARILTVLKDSSVLMECPSLRQSMYLA